jgi:hypothetical protein
VDVGTDFSEVDKLAERISVDHVAAFKMAKTVTKASGEAVADRARQAAPRDRGWLADEAIKTELRSRMGTVRIDVFAIKDPVRGPIGMWQEYGTVNMAPNPFMGPQVQWAETAYPDAIDQQFDPLG